MEGQKRTIYAEIVPEEQLRTIATIIGENSAAHAALLKLEELRREGKDPICVRRSNTLYIVDRSALEPALKPPTV